METIFTPELIEKAKQAKSAEELLAMAKENGIEMTEEAAKANFDKLNKSGELSDEELDNVSGGGCNMNRCPCCENYLEELSDAWRCRGCGRVYPKD